MLKKKLVIILILSSLFIFTACEVKVDEKLSIDSTIETARREIWGEIGSGNVSSASFAIMKNGNILYEEGFAMADRLTSSPVDTRTQFNIGSVTKVFTATAILQLVEAGTLELDQPVSNYLDDFSMADERYKDITVRMLLNHSSGLPGTYMVNGIATAVDPEFLDHFMAYLKTASLKSDPGSISVYCNDGFALAEILIKRVSGLNFADYMEENIFSKAKMKDTSCGFIEGGDRALHYNEEGLADPIEHLNIMGSGGISSTASDLCRFGDALLKNQLISAESFLAGASPQYGEKTVPVGKPIVNFGLGWDKVEVAEFTPKNVEVISKNGGTFQFSSQLYLLPEEDLSIALIFSGRGDVTGVTNTITAAFLEENELGKEAPEIGSTVMASIPAELLDFAGYYGSNGSIVKIEFDSLENQMIYQEYNGSEFIEMSRFDYQNNGTFQNEQGSNYSFNNEYGKKLLLRSLPQGNYFVVVGEEITPGPVLEANAFAGKWWIPSNLSNIDFHVQAINTEGVSEIPGLIAAGGDDSYTAYSLKDANQTKMILEYARDQHDLTIHSQGGLEILNMGGYQYKDVTRIPKMGKSETIRLDGGNSLRVLDYEGSIEIESVENSRVIVFGPDYTTLYDSLIKQSDPIDVVPGSILSLIGEDGSIFEITYTF